MRIALDVRAASHPQRGGFKTYTENLIRTLPRVDGDSHYVFYADRAMDTTVFADASNVKIKVVPAYLPPAGVIWREQVELPLRLSREGADLVHFPANTASLVSPCLLVVTIHDTITWDEKPKVGGLSLGDAIKRWNLHAYDSRLSRLAAKRACSVITDSENSKRDIVNKAGLIPDLVHVIHPAPSSQFAPVQNSEILNHFCAARHLTRPFIMGVSSASPRKNVRGLVEAYAALGAELIQQYRLVIVWTHGAWRNEIATLVGLYGLQNRILFLENVTDDELRDLYSAASLFAFPSLYEGFGLPPLEAMACGTPVVASNTSSMPEVLGDAALLVDPRDTAGLAWAMRRVLLDVELRATLVHRGFDQVSRYSWEKCARETVEVYREALLNSNQ